MRKRAVPLLGDKPQDVRSATERIASTQAAADTIVEYTVASGTNIISHGQTRLPSGRHIVWSTVGAIADVSLTDKKWTITTAAAGKIKVIWL